MKEISNMHDFLSDLSEEIRVEVIKLCSERRITSGSAIYRQGDDSTEMYQLLEGNVKLCNYTIDGREIVSAEFRRGDWIGEMGVIDGASRVSHAVAVQDSVVRVLSKRNFDDLADTYPVINKQLNIMLCRRLRMAWLMREEGSSLTMHQCLARAIHRLSYSHGQLGEDGSRYIAFSQDELGRMLGVSRQSINKGLKSLVDEQLIDHHYGKIFIKDINALHEKYESLIGIEQIIAVYDRPS